jgi:hypothetical protein
MTGRLGPDTMQWRPLVAAVAGRPALWPTALRQAARVAPRGWWRKWPPSPLPPASYVAFRLQTIYGERQGPVVGSDLVAYLEWCRRVGGRAG